MHRATTLVLVSVIIATLAPGVALAEWLPWNGQPMMIGQKFTMLVRGHCGSAGPDGGSGGFCGNGSEPIPPGWVEVAPDGYLVVGAPEMSPPDRAVFTVTAAEGRALSFNGTRGPVHAGAAGDVPSALRSGDAVVANAFSFDADDGLLHLTRNDGSSLPVAVVRHSSRNGGPRAFLAAMDEAGAQGAQFSLRVLAARLTLSAAYGTILGAGPDCSSTCVSPAQYPGTPITLHANTTPGYHFLHWGGLCEHEKTDVCTLPGGISTDGAVSATFSTQYELTVTVQGPGEVMVVGGSDTRCSAANPCVLPFVSGLKVPVMSLHPKDVVAWVVSTGQICRKSVSCDIDMNGNVAVVAKYTGQHCPGVGDCPAGTMKP